MRLQAVQSNTKTALYKYVKVYWSTSKKKNNNNDNNQPTNRRDILLCVLAIHNRRNFNILRDIFQFYVISHKYIFFLF